MNLRFSCGLTIVFALTIQHASAQKLTLTEARARIPERRLADFWCGDVQGLTARYQKLQTGHVTALAVSPGWRPMELITYGDREEVDRHANFNSAIGGGDPTAYLDKKARRKPVLFFVGPVHGQEVEGLTGLMNFIQVMETGRDLRGRAQPELRALGGKCRLLILPTGNPDGVARFEPRMLQGMQELDLRFWGQGSWSDGTVNDWPQVKRLHPMVGQSVGFLGCYFNDAGINPMHDEFFGPMSAESSAILRLAREEGPDLITSLHSHESEPTILRPAYVPAEIQEAARRFADRFYAKLAELHLPHGTPFQVQAERGTPPESFNLVSALYHVSGGTAFVFECPHGLQEERACKVTPEQILDLQLALYQSMMEYALEGR